MSPVSISTQSQPGKMPSPRTADVSEHKISNMNSLNLASLITLKPVGATRGNRVVILASLSAANNSDATVAIGGGGGKLKLE